MNIAFNIGYERDDLAATKTSASSRMVGSFNLMVAPSEKINANFSYTNFQTYTNVRSNFELVNKENELDRLDTLSFVQLSQSANINLNVVTKKTDMQSHYLNLNISYQDAANKQGGIYHPGSVSEMINAAASYSWTFLKTGLSLNSALNLNNSKILNGNTLTWGPAVGASSRLGKKVLLAGSLSYNTASLKSVKQNEVYICRLNGSYTPFQRHSITFAYNFQRRSALNRPETNTSLFTAGYSYSF
jgi:hypothetical protein